MSKLKTFFSLLTKPGEFILTAGGKGKLNWLSDKAYLDLVFRGVFGRRIDWKNPETFNEKLQWLKLYNRNPEHSRIVDKYEVKQYIADKLGQEFIIPTLGVWDSFDEIDFSALPEQFVLKCTHDSSSTMICRDKASFDVETARKELTRKLRKSLFWYGREWPYKSVKPRIIAEKYMTDSSGGLVDYKFFCFNGVVDCVMVCIDRHINDPKFYFFDSEWKLKRLNVRGKEAPEDFTLPMPEPMPRMFEVAKELSQNHPFIRVDLYECDGNIYFGELTFFPASGFDANLLEETDKYFGEKIELRGNNI